MGTAERKPRSSRPWIGLYGTLCRIERLRRAAAIDPEHPELQGLRMQLAGMVAGSARLVVANSDDTINTNITLTVRQGVPGSHRGMGWETFTKRVIQEVQRKANPAFMLWGQKAKRTRKLLVDTPPGMIIESPHPRMPTFPESRPFSRVNRALVAAGREVVAVCPFVVAGNEDQRMANEIEPLPAAPEELVATWRPRRLEVPDVHHERESESTARVVCFG